MTCLEHSQSVAWDLGPNIQTQSSLVGTGKTEKYKPLPALRPAGVLALALDWARLDLT